MANVVDKKRGLYALYLARSRVVSAERMFVTLYGAPVLSNDPLERILSDVIIERHQKGKKRTHGMYWLNHAFVY